MENLNAVISPSRLSSILVQVEASARSRGFSDERVQDIRTSVEEACLNALEHAGGSAGSEVTLEVTHAHGTFRVVVVSRGLPFDVPDKKPDIQKKMDGTESARGWGLYLIRSLANELAVESQDGENRLRMAFTHVAPVKGAERD